MVGLGQALWSSLAPLFPTSHCSVPGTMGSRELLSHALLPLASEPQCMVASLPQFSLLHLCLVNFHLFFMLHLWCHFLGQASSYRLKVCVPLKIICWSPNPQCDGKRWGLREVIRFRWWETPYGIGVFIRRGFSLWSEMWICYFPSIPHIFFLFLWRCNWHIILY